jgi:hypothetical protein
MLIPLLINPAIVAKDFICHGKWLTAFSGCPLLASQ